MKKSIVFSMVTAGAVFGLIGCGGGSSDPVDSTVGTGNPTPTTVTGIFKDTNVAGLNYACSSGKKDVTNANGEFTCNTGDTVTFSIGGYTLGGAVAASSGVVTPSTLYPNDLEAATNVGQLLQTFDDGADGTITIPEDFHGLDDVDTDPSDPHFDTVIAQELADEGYTGWVDEATAQEHMLRTMIQGQTLYTTIWDDMGTMESWAFNDDLTSSTWTEMVGGSAHGTGSLVIDGMTMTFTCTFDSSAECEVKPTMIEVKQILPDYLVVEVTGGELGSELETLRLYFDEAKARAYLLATGEAKLRTLLAGNTFYTNMEGESNTLESWTFNADLTSVTWTEMVGGNETGTETLTLDNMQLIINGDITATIERIEDDYILLNMNGSETRIYFDEANARAYFLSL